MYVQNALLMYVARDDVLGTVHEYLHILIKVIPRLLKWFGVCPHGYRPRKSINRIIIKIIVEIFTPVVIIINAQITEVGGLLGMFHMHK